MPIRKIHARQIYDSRGNPTVEVSYQLHKVNIIISDIVITMMIAGGPDDGEGDIPGGGAFRGLHWAA